MRSTLKVCFVAAALVALALPTMAGSISGTVIYEGKVPKLPAIKMAADPGCAKKHATAPQSEMLVLGDGNTMGNIFVQVNGVPGSHTAPSTAAVIDQDGCQYKPHVLGVMKGQKLTIKNSDGLLHNVHALPKVNKEFNMAMPGSRTEADVTFNEAEEMFKIKCDVHPWMNAYVAVVDHPYYAVTGPDGSFTLENLPPGTYTIEAWHEKYDVMEQTITIGDNETKALEFTYES